MIKDIPPGAFIGVSDETWDEFVEKAQVLSNESALLLPVSLLRDPLYVDEGWLQSVHIRSHVLEDDIPGTASRTRKEVEDLMADIIKHGLIFSVGIRTNRRGDKIRIVDGTHRIWIFDQLGRSHIRVNFVPMDIDNGYAKKLLTFLDMRNKKMRIDMSRVKP